MRRHLCTLLLTGAIGFLSTGCASMAPTMRAQSPGCTDGYCGEGCTSGNCNQGNARAGRGSRGNRGSEGGWGYEGEGLTGKAKRQSRRADFKNARERQLNTGPCLNLPFHPVHRNFHTYDAPTDLSYPDPNQPPAHLQWPYYTLRGPTDFFMK